ncbi:MAG: YjjG family noncanonical pyrimidine nucleotidase, partial [Lachnospiraceae bacterium]|nr:YjjG family noncanonical pyrimidine nucleotidase [Lachnospiraceae bacterium]
YKIINNSLWKELEHGVTTMEYVQNERFVVLFKQLDLLVDGEQANKLYHQILKHQCWLVSNAEEVCCYLSKKYKISIVTNGIFETQTSRIQNSRVCNFITEVFVSESIGFEKPDIHFFEHVFDKLHCSRDEVLIVGDSLSSDIQGGINAGIQTCWYNPDGSENKLGIMPDHIISNLRELYCLLPVE